VECKDVKEIHVAEDVVQWQTLLNLEMSLRILYKTALLIS